MALAPTLAQHSAVSIGLSGYYSSSHLDGANGSYAYGWLRSARTRESR